MKNYFLGALFLTLAACQQEVMPGTDENSETSPIVLKTMIDAHSQSRISNNTETGESAFVEGDKIGLFMAESTNPVAFTYNGVSWQASEPLYWPDNKNNFLFESFYPYVEEAQRDNIPMPSLLVQDGTLEDVSKKDFLTASHTQNFGENGVVTLSFSHQYSLMAFTIQITTDGDESATLQSLTLNGDKIVAPATYSFVSTSATVQEPSEGTELALSVNKPCGKEGESLYCLLNPVDLTSGLTVTCKYTVGGESYVATTTLSDPNLEKGNMYQYQLKVKERTIEVSGCTVSKWNLQELEDIVIDAFEDNNE